MMVYSPKSGKGVSIWLKIFLAKMAFPLFLKRDDTLELTFILTVAFVLKGGYRATSDHKKL